MERNGNGLMEQNSHPNPPFADGGEASVSTSNLLLDHVGEVVLTHTSDGLSWKLADAVPLYLSEMAPPKYRGAFNNGFQFSVGIGALSANLINFGTEKIKAGWGWRVSLAMAAVPASILTLGAIFLPETPNSLIQRNNNPEKAKKMLQVVRGTNGVQAELDDLITAKYRSSN